MKMQNLISEKNLTATIIKIHWERVLLYLDVKIEFGSNEDKTEELDFFAVDEMFYSPAEFKVLSVENDVFHLRLNVTNNGENICVPSGTYRILVCKKNEIWAECEVTEEIVKKAQEHSRTFWFNGRTQNYSVGFLLDPEVETLALRMCILCGTPVELKLRNRIGLLEKIQLFDALRYTWFSKKNIIRSIYRFFRLFGKKNSKKTILFMSEQNGTIASNLKAVNDRMIERGLDKEYRLLYSARSASLDGHGILSWIEVVKKLALSGTIIIDDHAPILDWLKIADDTKIIQLWHAGAGFKSSGYSRWGCSGAPGPVSCHRQYAYGIAGSKNIAHFFSEVWGINDEQVLPTGMPRMDEFLREDYRNERTAELYDKYPMLKGKKVMLFAPTYRGMGKRVAFYPYELIDFAGLYEACGDEYVVAFKMHPWVKEGVPIPEEYKDKFIDLGKYPKINDLFYITDLLVTDYSSSIFEYSLMGKPMMFFAYDKARYSLSRGFHRDYEEAAPGKVCYDFESFLDAFKNRDFELEKVEKYVKMHFDYIDSNASDRVIDWLVLGNMPMEFRNAIDAVYKRNAYRKSLDFLWEGCERKDKKFTKEVKM